MYCADPRVRMRIQSLMKHGVSFCLNLTCLSTGVHLGTPSERESSRLLWSSRAERLKTAVISRAEVVQFT